MCTEVIDSGKALDAMAAKAKNIGVQGVSAFLAIPLGDLPLVDGVFEIKFRVTGRMERAPDPERGQNDTGTNYLAVAMSKIAEMVSTLIHSGMAQRPAKFGEFKFKGGVIYATQTHYLFFAFSGGTPEEDVKVATAGAQALGLPITSL